MSQLIPRPLKAGDTIALVSTARAITQDELQEGIVLVESWGFKVKLGEGIGRKHFQQAGTDEERAADLRAAIEDPMVRAIWCARGGYGTVRLLDRIDLRTLQKDPKWIVGFSDVTVLHSALNNLGICSLHAQMPFNIGRKSDESKESIRQALFGAPADLNWKYQQTTSPDIRSLIRTGTCEGELIGGNLSILASLRGTPYDLDPKGKILFLEDLDELLYHVDRMIQNMRLGNWFKDLAGLLIGGMSDLRNKDPNDPFGLSAEEIISEATARSSFPIAFGFPAGHLDDNRAIVLGARVRLEVSRTGAALQYV